MGLHPASGRLAIRPLQLMDQARTAGLEGVELPIAMLQGEDIDAIARYAIEQRLFITLETEGYDPIRLQEAIALAKQLGVRTIRTFAGGARLGGDRRPLAGRWQPFLQTVLKGLQETMTVAEQAGINLTLENHQDLASEELLWLCETIGSPYFGITLDTGSTLATVEDPLDFVRKLIRYVKHVHLKDYQIYLSKEGYYLVRCSLGHGVIDFPSIFQMLSMHPDITMSIELGALEARHVRMLSDDFWPEYPPRSAAQLAHIRHFILDHAQFSGDWRSPFEKKVPTEAIVAYEQQQLTESLAYLHTLSQK
jgi:sugar phosphate isomerase/epimerase